MQMSNALFWLIVSVIALLVFVALILVKRVLGSLQQDSSHLDALPMYEEETTDGIFGVLTPSLAGIIPESPQERSDFVQLLRQAGYYSPSARGSVYALRFTLLFVPLVVTLVVALIVPTSYGFSVLIGGAMLSVVLSILPRFYIYLRQQSRIREIRSGLPDTMDMLSMCLSGGLPVATSLDYVARNLDSYPALSQELHILQKQADVGSLTHALADFSSRINIPEIRQLSSLLSRGDQLGTQLSFSLHEQADHFRETRKQVATMQANRAPVKLTFPLVFCFAPAALILLMAPAMLQVSDFAQNSEEVLGQSQLVRQMQQLDQEAVFEIGGQAPDGEAEMVP